jgi:hypothetical protein
VQQGTRLWIATAILTLLASGVAMDRIGAFGFSLGFGGPRPSNPKPLEHQLPYGKGMWIWQPFKSDGGDVRAMIARAKAVGLTHIYVRTGSSWDGFYAGPFLDTILPAAHAGGIRVYGWDFPRLMDVEADVQRATAAIAYETPSKQRIDGFAADIETWSEGTAISAEAAMAYGAGLRAATGIGYPLIACVPQPSEYTKTFYPYAEAVSSFDAIAPMVYWLNRQADSDVAGALADLIPLGKPIFPIGQAFDGAPEGGRPGVPSREELLLFMQVAHADGASGVSFWSWQGADQQAWDAIRDAPQFDLRRRPETFNRGQARSVQVLLSSLAFAAPSSGIIDQPTTAAIAAYQQAAGLPPTGVIDDVTYRLLMTPFPPPISPIV